MAGAKTQVNALFSSILLLVVILALGPLLEPLPMAVLAAIVMARGLFMQFKILPRLWKISRLDFAVWILSFTSTVVTDVQIGLLISVLFNVLSLGLREQWPKIYTLYSRPQKDIFKAEDNYQGECCVKSKRPVGRLLCVNQLGTLELTRRRTLVLECSAIAYVDQMGMEALQETYNDGKKCDIRVVFADVADSILDAMQATRFHDSVPKECFYPTLRDAVVATSRQATAGY